MFEEIRIAPSILSADFMNIQDEADRLEDAGADMIHVDVMDGHFVPNLTVGVPFVEQIKKISGLPLDVHLMISNPIVQLPWFLAPQPAYITVHLEALDEDKCEVEQAVELMRQSDVRAGIAIKPDMPIKRLEPYLEMLDMVLVMSVYPGFSGQSYIERSEERVEELVRICEKRGVSPLIQVDGGINKENISLVASCGADVFVAGNAVFKAENLGRAITELKEQANQGQRMRGMC